jgi:AraC-like DNA-binding protein
MTPCKAPESPGVGDFVALRFCATTLQAGRDQLVGLQDVVGRAGLDIDRPPLGRGPFHAEVVIRTRPRHGLAPAADPGRSRRRIRDFTADGNHDVILLMPMTDIHMVSHRAQDVTLAAGDAVLLSGVGMGSSSRPSGSPGVIIDLYRRRPVPLIIGIERAHRRAIASTSDAPSRLANYAEMLAGDHRLGMPDLQRAIVTQLRELFALTVGTRRDCTTYATREDVRAARLAAIKADITENIGRHELSIATVAARHGVTARHVQKLFEADGTTFSAFVLGTRLSLACCALNDPSRAGHNISSIAFELGFGDVSYFNREFRRCYGVVPSALRAMTRNHNGNREAPPLVA